MIRERPFGEGFGLLGINWAINEIIRIRCQAYWAKLKILTYLLRTFRLHITRYWIIGYNLISIRLLILIMGNQWLIIGIRCQVYSTKLKIPTYLSRTFRLRIEPSNLKTVLPTSSRGSHISEAVQSVLPRYDRRQNVTLSARSIERPYDFRSVISARVRFSARRHFRVYYIKYV